jgi:hypothetical protein
MINKIFVMDINKASLPTLSKIQFLATSEELKSIEINRVSKDSTSPVRNNYV